MMFASNPINHMNNEYESTHSLTTKNNENCQRSRFSKEEDELLKRLVLSSQPQPKWSEISRCLNNRTARQCRERYNNYLRPDLVNGPWSIEEEKLLLELYERHGPKWSLISQSFESRSSVNVKNHYSSLASQKSIKSHKNDNNEPKQKIPTNENSNMFIIEIKQRVNYENTESTVEKKENEDINLTYSSSEEDYSNGSELEFIMEEDEIGNILSNLEFNEEMWSFPVMQNAEEDLYIF